MERFPSSLPGEREALDRERIVKAAMALVDREGPDALTMRRLGIEMGVKGMSLYNHIPNKESLVSDIVQLMFSQVRATNIEAGSWKEEMREVMRSFRNVGLAHPNAFALYSARPASPVHPERNSVGLLVEAGFPRQTAQFVVRVLSSYVVGMVSREVAGAWQSTPDAKHDSLDEVFELGLSSLLDGLEIRLTEARNEGSSPKVTAD